MKNEFTRFVVRPTTLWRILAVVAVVGFGTVALSPPARTEQPAGTSEFMRAKLKQSQRIIEGLAVEDFGLIAGGAREITLLSKAAEWQVFKTEDYVQHSADFRRSAQALEKAGLNRNLDGAALAYMEMTMKCVNCHKYVRSIRMASVESEPLAERLVHSAPVSVQPISAGR